MEEITELEEWLKSLTTSEHEIFFRKAAKFFSSRELSGIIKSIQKGETLFAAHKHAGVLSRHIVDLIKIKDQWTDRA